MVYDGGCAALGTMVLANWLPNRFYTNNHVKDDGTVVCVGTSCFSPTHLIIATLNLSAALAAIVISVRSRKLYKEISKSHAKKKLAEETSPCLNDLLNELDFPEKVVE